MTEEEIKQIAEKIEAIYQEFREKLKALKKEQDEIIADLLRGLSEKGAENIKKEIKA